VAEIIQRDIVAVHPDDDVESLLRVTRAHELPGVPVTDASGKVVGIVPESDLVIREDGVDLRLPHHIDRLGGVSFLEPIKHHEERLRRAFAATIGDMMTSDPVTVRPDDSIHDAAKLIAERRHNRLPVVDDEGQLLGVVTGVDVLEAVTR